MTIMCVSPPRRGKSWHTWITFRRLPTLLARRPYSLYTPWETSNTGEIEFYPKPGKDALSSHIP